MNCFANRELLKESACFTVISVLNQSEPRISAAGDLSSFLLNIGALSLLKSFLLAPFCCLLPTLLSLSNLQPTIIGFFFESFLPLCFYRMKLGHGIHCVSTASVIGHCCPKRGDFQLEQPPFITGIERSAEERKYFAILCLVGEIVRSLTLVLHSKLEWNQSVR